VYQVGNKDKINYTEMHGQQNINTLHVSDGLSVHHQESKTAHTTSGICQTEIPEMNKIASECIYRL
jgi:hypothetical protein